MSAATIGFSNFKNLKHIKGSSNIYNKALEEVAE